MNILKSVYFLAYNGLLATAFVVIKPKKIEKDDIGSKFITQQSQCSFQTFLSHQKLNVDLDLDHDESNDYYLSRSQLSVPFPSNSNITGIAKTLSGRLLCASKVAYQTSFEDRDANTEPNYFKAVQYKQSTTATKITKSVNSAFVGTNVDGIVVAFRGTLFNSPLDWLQNAALVLRTAYTKVTILDKSANYEGTIKNEPKQMERVKLPGKVHSGFLTAVRSLWKPLIEEIQKRLDQSEKNVVSKIYFCGHSKGGAMASLAAFLFNLDPSLPNVTAVYTFASAKVGNSAFRDAYNRYINQTSYESYLDIVPFLPPSKSTMEMCSDDMSEMINGMLWPGTTNKIQKDRVKKYSWDYQPVGKRVYINENAQIITNVTKELDDARIKDLERKTLLQIQQFAAAHCAGCPSVDEEESDDEIATCNGFFFKALAYEVCKTENSQYT